MEAEHFNIHSEEGVRDVVRHFEDCLYTPAEFHHRLHLVVTTWYLLQLSESETLNRMRQNLRKFSNCHQVKGYHETITRFWVLTLAQFLSSRRELPLTAIISEVLASFGDKQYIYRFYTAERLMSEQARRESVAPDVSPSLARRDPS